MVNVRPSSVRFLDVSLGVLRILSYLGQSTFLLRVQGLELWYKLILSFSVLHQAVFSLLLVSNHKLTQAYSPFVHPSHAPSSPAFDGRMPTRRQGEDG